MKLSLHSYVSFLVKRYKRGDKELREVALTDGHSHRWFGLLPFWWRCLHRGQKNNVLLKKLKSTSRN